jgi:uncharacterized membrane protein
MASTDDQGRVSKVSRVLAWIVVAFFALGFVVAIVKAIFRGYWAHDAVTTFLGLLGPTVFVPIFLFVAWKGRWPKWLSSLEQFPDRFAARRGIRQDGMRFYESALLHSAAAAFGAGLFTIGNSLGLFEGESAWFAILIFALAWLIVLALLVVYVRKRRSLRRPASSQDRAPVEDR